MFNKLIISKQNLLNNLLKLKAKAKNTKLCAMVKANAYGVGAEFVVKTLTNHVDFFGVCCVLEAEEIAPLTDKPILITSALDREHINTRFSYTCNCVEDVCFLASLNQPIKVHLKINSGMNRFGTSSLKEFELCLNKIKSSKLVLEGLYTHFATSDKYVNTQLKKFNKFVALAKKHNLKTIIHTDNSSVFNLFNHKFDMARIGFDLYCNNKLGFNPVATIQTTIEQINKVKAGQLVGYDRRFVANKNIKVAVLPVGYADGFDMHYIGLNIDVDGKKCKVLNICMDCFMLDVGNTALKKGDKIYILNSANPLSNYANHSSTSEYEVMCKFGSIRAERILH